MDRMLYVAMSGAKETLLAQANTANNLANATSTGFLADFNQLRSMPVFGAGYPTRVYAMDERPQTDFAHGSIEHTGRDLDVAVRGGGWLAVQGLDGTEAYTRRGDLWVDENGLLKTGEPSRFPTWHEPTSPPLGRAERSAAYQVGSPSAPDRA